MDIKIHEQKNISTERQMDVKIHEQTDKQTLSDVVKIDDVTETNLSKQAKRDKEAFLFKGSNSFIFQQTHFNENRNIKSFESNFFSLSQKTKKVQNKSAKHISLNGPSGEN